MTGDGTWHVPGALLAAYLTRRTGPAQAASVEAHLTACAGCRALLDTAVPAGMADRMWAAVADRVDAPAPTWLERLLVRAQVRPTSARLLAATPWLRRSWLLATVLVLAFAVAASGFRRGDASWTFLLLAAPLLPVLGVATAFGAGVDPAYDITATTPAAGLRLLLLRCVAVLTTNVVLSLGAALLMPSAGEPAVWLLPAFGLTLLCLALATWVGPELAGVAVTVLWVGGAAASTFPRVDSRTVDLAASYAVFQPAGQSACLLVTIVCAGVLWARRSALTRGAGR